MTTARRNPARRLAPAAAAGLALALTGVLATPAVAAPLSTTVDYAPSDAVVANPERGFYHHTETHYRAGGEGWAPLDAAVLDGWRGEGVTQVLRVVYLDAFVDTPTLDQDVLDRLQADYDTARTAGMSVITRFAYVQGGSFPYTAPYGDAPLDVVLAHIEQLGPVLRANADVIPVVQSGFIGLWGEGYYTDDFASDPANPGVLTEEDQAKRRAVYEALLAELPADRSIQLRTMAMKQSMLGVPTGVEGAITDAQAHDGSAISRVGHHNDCFLAAPDDWGTFLSDPITLDQEYLEQETRSVPMGGETCNVNPPRSEWASASAEMARYHYSYLNRDYLRDVLTSWGEAGLTETAQRLGYRFVLEQSRLTSDGAGGADLAVDVRNDGWAAPYNARPATLVLTDDAGETVTVPLDADVRDWAAGTTSTVTAELEGLPEGTWSVGLAMPSASASVAADPRFAVQTANEGTWDADSGVNDLGQQIVVAAAAVPPVEEPVVPVEPGVVAPPVVVDPVVVDRAVVPVARDRSHGSLAATGTESGPLALGALAALLLGGAATLVARRRTASARSGRDRG